MVETALLPLPSSGLITCIPVYTLSHPVVMDRSSCSVFMIGRTSILTSAGTRVDMFLYFFLISKLIKLTLNYENISSGM
jgi:hypothetical protein